MSTAPNREHETRGERFRRRRRKKVKKAGKRLVRRMSHFLGEQSKIGDPHVFETSLFPSIATLEANFRTIRDEVAPMLELMDRLPLIQDLSPDQARIANGDLWRSFVLYGFGKRADRNCALLPQTANLVAQVPGLESAWFSILLPGYRIPKHRGITKGLITALIGVKVPEKRDMCGIRIEDEVFHYEDGQSIVFDDTIDHEIWNDSDEMRVVLIVDFRRPMRLWGRAFNEIFLAGFKRTGYVREAYGLFAEWDDDFHAFLAADPNASD